MQPHPRRIAALAGSGHALGVGKISQLTACGKVKPVKVVLCIISGIHLGRAKVGCNSLKGLVQHAASCR